MKWHERLFALLLILLPTQLGLHFWPQWAMVLGRRVDYLSPTVYLTDIVIVFVILFWIIESFSRIKNYELRIKNKNIILLGLFIGVNIYVAANQPVAIYKWLKVLEFVLLGWYIVKTRPNYSLITSCLSVGVLYSSLIAIGQFVFQHSLGGIFWWLGERTFTADTPGIARIAWSGRELLRAYGTFSHPNVLGGFLAITLPLLLLMKKRTWFIATSIGLGIIALILTFSRGALIVGLVAIVVVIPKNKRLLMILALILAIFVFTKVNPLEESVVVRKQLNAAAMSLWQESPLFGVGLGNFLVRLPEVLPSRHIYFLQPVHNVYLLVLSEVGILGLLVFLYVVRLGLKNFQFSLLALLLLGFVDHYPFTLQQGQLLFTLVLALGLVQ